MLKDIKAIEKEKELFEALNGLDDSKIHILYYSYNLSWKNFFHNPLFLTTKILGLFTRKKAIEHVAHISKFIKNKDEIEFKTFEASRERAMHEADLFDKIINFDGTVYVETLGNVDKPRAKKFELKYQGVKYSRPLAALAGLDITLLDKLISRKRTGLFCSSLEVVFLQDQRCLNPMLDPFEVTPSDLFEMNLGSKKILFKS